MEQRLPGGNAGGAVLVDGTVRRASGPWTPAVHALLGHLQARGFAGAPRVLGIDSAGREVLTYLPGATVGTARPWPLWVHTEQALVQVGAWLRAYHAAVADFVPPPGALWRTTRRPWQPGDVVGHNDAAPYNAVWQLDPVLATDPDAERNAGTSRAPGGRLVGFVDWDFAAPCSSLEDLAYVAFSWVPLHARHVVAAEGFSDRAARPARLRVLMDAYGWTGSVDEVLDAVAARVAAHAQELRELAAAGDPLFAGLVQAGVIDDLDQALVELEHDVPRLRRGT